MKLAHKLSLTFIITSIILGLIATLIVFTFLKNFIYGNEIVGLSKNDNLPFFLITKEGSKQFTASAIQLAIVIGIFIISTAILSAMVSSLFISHFLKPLDSFLQLTREVAKGNFKTKIKNNSKNELGQLAQSFNLMIDTISQSKKTIDQKVEVQTKEIFQKQQLLEEQKKNEALAKDLAKFKLAIGHASNQVIFTNPDGILTYANKATEEITGFKIAEMIGKKIDGHLWGGQMSQKFYQQLWYQIKIKKQNFLGEIINKRKNGETYFTQTEIIPMINTQNEVEFFVGIEKNITQEKKCKQMMSQMSAIVTNSKDAIISEDLNGNITSWNKGAENLFGYKSKEILGKSITLLLPKDVPQKNKFKILDEIAKDKNVDTKKIRIKKDGSQISVAISVSPIKNDQNKIVGASIIARDINREKEVDRMKNEFISLASHQLRTPLSAMKWFLEMLLNSEAGDLNPEQQNYLNAINQSNERMISLVNGLLNISRIESGRIIIDPKLTDLNRLLTKAVKKTGKMAKEKQQKIILRLDKKIPKIKIDQKLIIETFLNLITNSIKYSQEKTQIIITSNQTKTDLIFQFSDHGVGIPKRYHDQIFNKFFRAKNVLHLDTDGTGLGLYLVKAIVESSNGKIWFESKENKGTTFFVSLPKSSSPAKKGTASINKNKTPKKEI